jgi:hypothetical protein
MNIKNGLLMFHQMGYLVGKFVAIQMVPAVPNDRIFGALVLAPVTATFLWTIFGLTSLGTSNYTFLVIGFCVFPMAFVWGLLYRYLEGRQGADIIGAALSVSYILAGGAGKSLGKSILEAGINEYFMPAVVAAATLPVYIFFAFLVSCLPPPSLRERRLQTVRVPMSKENQVKFLFDFWPGVMAILIAYSCLSALRVFRDCFQAEIWEELYDDSSPEVFTLTELPVALAVCGALATLNLIEKNALSVRVMHIVFILGNLIAITSQLLFDAEKITGTLWFIMLGVGVYVAYVPIAAVFSDRLMAALQAPGTATLIMNLWDAVGPIGTVSILLWRDFGDASDTDHYEFYSSFSIFCLVACFICNAFALWYWSAQIDVIESKASQSVMDGSSSKPQTMEDPAFVFQSIVNTEGEHNP